MLVILILYFQRNAKVYTNNCINNVLIYKKRRKYPNNLNVVYIFLFTIIMNLPRYQFHSHSESNLLLFLKTANDHKNELYCDLNEYEKAKLLCPLVFKYY